MTDQATSRTEQDDHIDVDPYSTHRDTSRIEGAERNPSLRSTQRVSNASNEHREKTNGSDDVKPVVVRSISPSIEITLTPRDRMSSSKLHDISSIPRRHLARLTEIDELRKRTIEVMHPDRRVESAEDEWRHQSREEERLSEDEEGELESLEDEQSDRDSVEGDGPGLSTRFVRSIVDKQKLHNDVSELFENESD